MLEEILVELKVISKINENQKISTVNNSTISIEKDDIFQGSRRYIWSDSRQKTVNTIENIIDKSIDYSTSCINSSYLNIYNLTTTPSDHEKESHFREYAKIKNLTSEINNTIKGITNLQKTYKADAIISSQLDVIIHKIKTHSSMIETKLEQSRPIKNSNSDTEL